MARTKKYFADRVLLGLQDSPGFNIDWKIQPREIFLIVDDIVNSLAKQNYIENMKMYGATIDEGFVTEWSGDNAISVVDPDDAPSYLIMPAIPIALPMNGGVLEVWPENYEYGAVKLMQHSDVRRTRRLMSGNMQGELGGFLSYVNGSDPRFVFNQISVGKDFANKFGVRLAVKDSTQISETQPFPIPSDLEEQIIQRAIEFCLKKRLSPTDLIRDSNDALTRN